MPMTIAHFLPRLPFLIPGFWGDRPPSAGMFVYQLFLSSWCESHVIREPRSTCLVRFLSRSEQTVRSYDVCSDMYVTCESNDHDDGDTTDAIKVLCISSNERRSINSMDSPVPPIQWQGWVRLGQGYCLCTCVVPKWPPTWVLLP